MRGYSWTDKVFEMTELFAFDRVSVVMRKLPERDRSGEPLRCHEIARAMRRVLSAAPGQEDWITVDGQYGPIDHTWLVRPRSGRAPVILDVYAVGRLPLVQLVLAHVNLGSLYRPGAPRVDIRSEVIEDIVREAIGA